MARRDEYPAVVRVAVLESRRLLRQMLSIWLTAREGVTLAGNTGTPSALAQLHRSEQLDVVLVGVDGVRDALDDVGIIGKRHPELRLIALTRATDDTFYAELLERGFSVVPMSAHASLLLEVILAQRSSNAVIEITEPIDVFAAANPLTPREAEVLSLVGQGSTTLDISQQLGISRSTVANHKERIFTKLQAKNQAHAVARAVNLGLISPTLDDQDEQDDLDGSAEIEAGRREDPRWAG